MNSDALQATLRPYAEVLARQALTIDADPAAVRPLLASDEVPFRQICGLPPEYVDDPLRVDGKPVHIRTCLARTVASETLAWGDASVVVGMHGPSMAGVLVDDLADDGQRDRFYSAVAQAPTWTFFALTEPDRGSDAGAMTTVLAGDGAGGGLLRGTKKYVGNGARATTGVLFARHRPGPLGVGVYLVDATRPGFDATALTTLGLRGVELSEIRLHDVVVEPQDVLGRHLTPTRRGLLGAVRTFTRLRPVVGSLALGVAQAAHDYVLAHRRALRADERASLDRFGDRLHACRTLVRSVAAAADHDASDGTLSALAKASAVTLADDLTAAAPAFFGPGSRWEHPLLDKLIRDVRGLELMEGTTTIQHLTIARGHLQGRTLDVTIP